LWGWGKVENKNFKKILKKFLKKLIPCGILPHVLFCRVSELHLYVNSCALYESHTPSRKNL
jgi:hypothetical protein